MKLGICGTKWFEVECNCGEVNFAEATRGILTARENPYPYVTRN